MKNYKEKLQIGRMRPQRGEMVRRLRTRACHFGTVSRLRARAALWPLWGPILASWPKWRQTGASKPLSFEDDYRFQNRALSFEDDYHFRPSEDAFCQSPDFEVFHKIGESIFVPLYTRGRRKLPQALEVRRPLGGRVW